MKMHAFIQKHELTYGGKRFLSKAILILSLFFLSYAAILLFHGWYAIIFVAVLTFAKIEIGLSVMHDANHGAASKKSFLNKLLGNTLLLVWLSPSNWREKHNVRHHGQTNVLDHDEDIDVAPFLLRFSEHKPLYLIHKLQHVYAWFLYPIQTVQWIFFWDFSMSWRYSEGKPTNKRLLHIWKMAAIKLFYVFFMIVLPRLLTPYSLWTIIGVFFIMHWVIWFTTAVVFQLAHVVEHAEMVKERKDSFVLHQFATTADFAPNNPILTRLFWWLNYQVVHHLFPKVCHIHYPKIAKEMRKVTKKLGIDYKVNSTFVDALKAHVIQLRILWNNFS